MYFLFTQQTIAVSFIKRIDEPMKNMNETKRPFDVCVCVCLCVTLCLCVSVCIVFVAVAQNAARAARSVR